MFSDEAAFSMLVGTTIFVIMFISLLLIDRSKKTDNAILQSEAELQKERGVVYRERCVTVSNKFLAQKKLLETTEYLVTIQAKLIEELEKKS